MSNDPLIVLVILNWNNAKDTLDCLESVEKLDYPNYQVLVVDNGSSDGSVEKIRTRYPQVHYLENGSNLGYAEGNNRGVEAAWQMGADYAFVINNDTVLAPDILKRLVQVGEAGRMIGAVGPKIYYYAEPSKIWFAGGKVDWRRGFAVDIGEGEDDLGQYEEVNEVDFLTGCALMIRRSAWEKAGQFDPRFFMYYEETDWCARVHQAGFQLLFVPQAKMWHKISPAQQRYTPRILYYMTRNSFLFFFKNLPFPTKIRVLAHGLWNVYLNLGNLRKMGQGEQAQALLQGTADFFRGQFGQTSVIAGRKQI